VAAFTETFLTWGILGACTMQITSHNRPKHLLHRDASLVIILTIAVLVLAAFLANTCVHLLEAHGYMYLPSSFGKSLALFSTPLSPHQSEYSFAARNISCLSYKLLYNIYIKPDHIYTVYIYIYQRILDLTSSIVVTVLYFQNG